MTQDRPTYSVVSAVYNVARYLPEYIDSIESQQLGDRLQVIMVDDGSTDNSPAVIQEWISRSTLDIQLITKENGGQASARNVGIALASGEWVTFIDPDDIIGPGYFRALDHFLAKHPDTRLLATNRLIFRDGTGDVEDVHPLRWMFAKRNANRQRNLNKDRYFFHGSAPAALFRLDELKRSGRLFDERIRPNFEDGHFCIHYLLEAEEPLVGFVKDAEYLYRKRNDDSSTLQQSSAHPGRLSVVPELGYLDVLASAQDRYQSVPQWVQEFILYELSWYFQMESRVAGALLPEDPQAAERFNDLLSQILGYLDTRVIDNFRAVAFKDIWRDILRHSYSAVDWHSPAVVTTKRDVNQGMIRVQYRYIGRPPTEHFAHGENRVDPLHSKHRQVFLFGRIQIWERIMWFADDAQLSARLGGSRVKHHKYPPIGPVARSKTISNKGKVRALALQPNLIGRTTDRLVETILAATNIGKLRRAARTQVVQAEFGNAWVLLDRLHDADDSGEHLFRYLRDRYKGINAWFVLEQDTPDWERLVADGFGDRLVAYKSDRWRNLMLNCDVVISSHADMPVQWPPEILEISKPKWKFVFLQHGIIKDDLSNWLNPKGLDLFVSSTPKEFESIAGDGNSYIYTSEETKLTELPRFDLLREKALKHSDDDRRWLLVGPTWRQWLVASLPKGSQRRELSQSYLSSEYHEQWSGFLASPELAAAADRQNLQIAFLPHPNLSDLDIELPDHVRRLSFAGNDVRQFFVDAGVFVTDYSSMAFNAAYIDRPVVYFQFDQNLMFGGAHVGRGGYFDYAEQGFGPVATTVGEATSMTITAMTGGPLPSPMYQRRIESTFPYRDGLARERVTQAIQELMGTNFQPTSMSSEVKVRHSDSNRG